MSPIPVNEYYQRKVAEPGKPCFICYKPTAVCLATADLSDYFYTCPGHLSHKGFVTEILPPITAPTSTNSKSKEKKSKKKKDAGNSKEDENNNEKNTKDSNDNDKDQEENPKKEDGKKQEGKKSENDDDEDKGEDVKGKEKTKEAVGAQRHRKFMLHPSFLEMRRDHLRQIDQAKSAKSAAVNFPSVPKTPL